MIARESASIIRAPPRRDASRDADDDADAEEDAPVAAAKEDLSVVPPRRRVSNPPPLFR